MARARPRVCDTFLLRAWCGRADACVRVCLELSLESGRRGLF